MIGNPIDRLEDDRLLRGAGKFLGNLRLPGLLHAVILRSPLAAARIARIDTRAARAISGVIAVYTFADLADRLKAIPQISPHPSLRSRMPFPLAGEVVRHEGEAVAVVVGETLSACEAAREAIDVVYEPFVPVLDAEQALVAGCAKVHGDLPDNVSAHFAQEIGDVDAALAHSHCVLTETLRIGRLSAQPLETRAVVARFEPGLPSPQLTAWFNTQAPHISRLLLAQQLGLAASDIRVIAPDVGGGFGVKNRFFPENTLIPLLAMTLARPVRWMESRSESFTSTYHERQQVHEVTIGLNADGTIKALRDRFVYDQGAYTPLGVVVPFVTSVSIPGPYRVPNFSVECTCAYTNKTPSAPYRGAGKPQASFVMERMLDLGAHKLELDPVEVRRRNLIEPHQFPYDTGLQDLDGTRVTYDSGRYAESLDRTLELIGHTNFAEEKARASEAGRSLGLGVACFIEMTGRGPYESALVRVDAAGRVQVHCGISSQGQGHQTTLAQVCAERLEIEMAQVQVHLGDTATIPLGIGVYAARCAVMAGNAVAMAADAVKQKAILAAAALFGVSSDQVEYAGGKIRAIDTNRTLSIGEVAGRLNSPAPGFPFPPEFEPGLEALRYYRSNQPAYSNGTYAAVVELDRETGHLRIVRHALTHDCGVMLNPAIVHGQLIGGVAQGIGAALFEELQIGPDGQILNPSFETYLLPRATEIPTMLQAHVVTPSPFNPLGVKGVGEAGTIPVSGALAAAIESALGNGARVTFTPMTPPRLWSLTHAEDESNPREDTRS